MASVKVAVRVRPFNEREILRNSDRIIAMEGKTTKIINTKVNQLVHDGEQPGRECKKEFVFDYSYWSFCNKDKNYVSQEQVFNDLGTDVVDNAFEGYNACLFAYGQTGSGKTHTMMGSDESLGLIPRICQSLFNRMVKSKHEEITYRTEVSYLEIYNEKVKDLLISNSSSRKLRVREHPQSGPFVENLSNHLVMVYHDIYELIKIGNSRRSTASTSMNDVSSRSHAIFTITFVQAKFSHETPSETVSKINLVDLAGSERAHVNGVVGERLKEGCYINKSLVTLGVVISALAEKSLSANNSNQSYIPYRNSVLTWLLRDSLGGNSKTIMIATISPSHLNYGETMSTLRYANRAKNIRNNPTINEDHKVKLIRELRAEISRLKSMLKTNENGDSLLMSELQANEVKVNELAEEWAERWAETKNILEEQKTLALRKSGVGVVLESDQPHLLGINGSTGITFYPLKEGVTYISTETVSPEQEIVLISEDGSEHSCEISLNSGEAWLNPLNAVSCLIGNMLVQRPTLLTHGSVIVLGRSVFLYNNPTEALELRKFNNKEKISSENCSRFGCLSWSSPDLIKSLENLNSRNSPPVREERPNMPDLTAIRRSCPEAVIAQEIRKGKGFIKGKINFEEDLDMPLTTQISRSNLSLPLSTSCQTLNPETVSITIEKELRKIRHICAQISPENDSLSHFSEQISNSNFHNSMITVGSVDSTSSPTPCETRSNYFCDSYNAINAAAEKLHDVRVALETMYEELKTTSACDVNQHLERIQVLVSQFRSVEKELKCFHMTSSPSNSVCGTCWSRGVNYEDKRSNASETPLSVVSLMDEFDERSSCRDSTLSSSSRQSSSQYSFCFVNDLLEEHNISVNIPSFLLRGSGSRTHFEYEVKISVNHERWTILRRFQRFRDLHEFMKRKYGSDFLKNVRLPKCPWFNRRSEAFAEKRRQNLEVYLHDLLTTCLSNKICHLYAYSDSLSRKLFCEYIPFFEKGHFETTKFETG